MARKERQQRNKAEFEDPEKVLTRFDELYQGRVSVLQVTQAAKSLMSSVDCKKREARQKIDLARNYFNEMSYSLMKYHLRYCSDKLLGLEKNLRGLQTKKKKFRFRSVKRPAKDYAPKAPADQHLGPTPTGDPLEGGADLQINEFVVSDRQNETILIEQSESDNMRIKNLKGCQVKITARLKTVYLNNLVDCTLTIFPIENSIFGDEISDSQIHCCAQQIRIHHTVRCSFSIFVSSSMIIEDR